MKEKTDYLLFGSVVYTMENVAQIFVDDDSICTATDDELMRARGYLPPDIRQRNGCYALRNVAS